MILMKTDNTNYVMSDDMALGVFDSDGSVLLNVAVNPKPSDTSQNLSFNTEYYLGQSELKDDLVDKFAEKFSNKKPTGKSTKIICVSPRTPQGKTMREFLLKNKPLHPDRRRDFLLSEQVLRLLENKAQTTQVGLVTLSRIVSNKSVLKSQGKSQEKFAYYLTKLRASLEEINTGIRQADQIVAVVEQEVEHLTKQLPQMKLSNDYVLGAHYGDGSLHVALTWKPTKIDRLRCDPQWAVYGANKAYCEAFVNTFVMSSGRNPRGITNKMNKSYKYVISGIQKSKALLPLFENAPWMPRYKKEQLDRFKKAVQLLAEQRHLKSKKAIVELVELVYGYAEKGARKYTKNQYIEWGCAYLDRRGITE